MRSVQLPDRCHVEYSILCVVTGQNARAIQQIYNFCFVTKSDGSVYPCDFYALDEWKIGTVGRQSLEEMEAGATARRFIEDSCRIPEECHTCPACPLCHNGCRRSRVPASGGLAGRFRFCDAYRRFFAERYEELCAAAQIIAGLHGRWS